jgi:hypothetical protein
VDYFQMTPDKNIQNAWTAKNLTVSRKRILDETDFTSGKKWEDEAELWYEHSGDLELPVFFGPLDLPVVREDLCVLLRPLIDGYFVQVLPLKIKDSTHSFSLLNPLKIIDCVEEKKSVFEKFDDQWQDQFKRGDYKFFFSMHLEKSKIEETSMFRVSRFTQALIVDEKIKKLFEKNKIKGAKFKKVT